MAKESSEGELLKKKVLITIGKGLKILSKANAVKENVIHLDQLEFLPIFSNSELLIWMLPAPNVTEHSYFDSVYLKLFTALSFLANYRILSLPMYCRLEEFFFVKNNLRSATHESPENWVLHGFGRHVVRPWTVPNLGMPDREFELWTGTNMGSSDLEYGLETGPVRGLADPELA